MAKIKETVKTSFNALEKDLQKFVNATLRIAAGTIRDELTEATTWAIARFYMDYSPEYYNRHYYNFMNNSYKKYYSNAHNKWFIGGVEFTPEAMDSVYKKAPVNQVFDMVYAGMHGPSTAFHGNPPAMVPSPMDLIFMKKEEIESNIQKYVNKGMSKAKTEQYSVLKF